MRPPLRSALILVLAASAITACQKTATAQATDQAQDAASSAAPASATVASDAPSANKSVPLRPGGATLDGPDGQSITFLYYSILGGSPPLKDWANDDARLATSDEFARQRAAADNLAAYQGKFAEAGKVGHVVITIATQLSDYDMQRGEFYLETFSPVATVDFQYKDRDVKLAFVNGEKAQHWRIATDQADAALKQNYGLHAIQVETHADVVAPRSDLSDPSRAARARARRRSNCWNCPGRSRNNCPYCPSGQSSAKTRSPRWKTSEWFWTDQISGRVQATSANPRLERRGPAAGAEV